MHRPAFAYIDLEDRISHAPSREALAQAYIRANRRAGRRPRPVKMIYRYPRGRVTDLVPLSAALDATAGLSQRRYRFKWIFAVARRTRRVILDEVMPVRRPSSMPMPMRGLPRRASMRAG